MLQPISDIGDADFGDGVKLMDIDTSLSDQDYVQICVKQAMRLFNQERGRKDAKTANLGDIKSTSIHTPPILQEPFKEHKAQFQ
jgi:hypothetical protein